MVESWQRGGAEVAREAHNLEVAGAIPAPATQYPPEGGFCVAGS